MSIFEELKEIIFETCLVDKNAITEEASFTEDLGIDSLDAVEISWILEEKYNIVIPDEDFEKIKTVGDAVKYLESIIENPQ
ncbi:MAG: acyl carrier protein [Candidatus Absconditabacterales bacterium]|nr:acyl carrier protein [Candidatus Absconditabacterales bacterium]